MTHRLSVIAGGDAGPEVGAEAPRAAGALELDPRPPWQILDLYSNLRSPRLLAGIRSPLEGRPALDALVVRESTQGESRRGAPTSHQAAA